MNPIFHAGTARSISSSLRERATRRAARAASTALCAVLFLATCAALADGQERDLPGLPFSGSSGTAGGTATQPAAGKPRVGFGQLPNMATLNAPPSFVGGGLFNGNPPFLAGVKVNHDDLLYHEGDHLVIEFSAERASYLYLIYHQADGTSLLLFPNEARTDNHILPQKSVMLPAADEDFGFRVRAPFGTEVLQVLATLKPAAELDSLVQKTGRAAPVSREVLDRLQTRLKKDASSWSEHRVSIRTADRGGEPKATAATRAGVFIGVSKSQKTGQLTARFGLGCELMAKTMLERGGLDRQHVAILEDEDASRANIETAITKWLPSVTKPGDTVFIFYCGHGGVTSNPDRPDQRDGFLTTYDDVLSEGRLTEAEWEARCREKFITDTALARWLQELAGRQIVLILSTCHAGSMIDADILAKAGAREAARVKGISQINVTVLASCSPEESTSSPKNAEPIFMAQYLAKAMTDLPAPVTLRQAYDYYHEAMRSNLRKLGHIGVHEPVLTDTALLPIQLVPAASKGK